MQFKLRARFLFLLLSTFVACNAVENKVDKEVDESLTEIFHGKDPTLWQRVESEFFNRINTLGLIETEADTLGIVFDFIKYIQDQGYPREFYVDHSNPQTIQLINDLKEIGYVAEDESAQRFLHGVCKPIIETYKYVNRDDSIYKFGSYDPDSVRISYELSIAVTPTGFGKPNLKRKGLYKVMILMYFSKMVRSDKSKRVLPMGTNLDI